MGKEHDITVKVRDAGTPHEDIELQAKGRKDGYVVGRDGAGWWHVFYKNVRGEYTGSLLAFPPKQRQAALDHATELMEELILVDTRAGRKVKR